MADVGGTTSDADDLDRLVWAEEHSSIVLHPMFGVRADSHTHSDCVGPRVAESLARLQNIRDVFRGIANLGDVDGEAELMDKAELVRAHGGGAAAPCLIPCPLPAPRVDSVH